MTNVIELADHEWRKALTWTKEGAVAKDPGNAAIYLLNDPAWRGSLQYDEFSDRMFWAKPPPLIASGLEAPKKDAEVCDRDALYVHHWFARVVGVKFSHDTLMRALEYAAHQNKICPPRQYLRSLKWDGVERLKTMFSRLFGAEQTQYTASVGRWWMISAVARMLEPGCKADCILILQGAQGAKKSSALGVLGGAWYSNSLPDVTNKDAQISLFGSWIIEIAELEAMNRSAASAFKAFSARTFDKFRKPYGRFEQTHQRTCVFAGTTNDEKVLSDPTGARRFWPVHVAVGDGVINLNGLAAERDQLWAEAVHWFEAGEQWWPTRDMAQTVTDEQDERYADDVWAMRVAEWCDKRESTGAEEFTVSDILTLALGIDIGRQNLPEATRVGKIMRRLGYGMPRRRTVAGKRFSVYAAKRSTLQLTNPREPGEDDG